MQTNSECLTIDKRLLPNGWAELLAEMHNVHPDFVRKVRRGERSSVTAENIYQGLIDLAVQHKAKISEIQQRVHDINN